MDCLTTGGNEDVSGSADYMFLSSNLLALIQEAKISFNDINTLPDFVQNMWGEIQSLNNVAQSGKTLRVDFGILETPEMAEALEVVRETAELVTDLRDLVSAFNDGNRDVIEISASDCNTYFTRLVANREKLTNSLNFLQMFVFVPR
jgi:2-hydroxy-3-keto-5-methylthiopentenyl-1-phosphate phosphatase